MFGHRRSKADEEAAREAERRALFEELAKRPDTICPFLGLADKRTEYSEAVTDQHRCYAFGDPAELSAEQQQKVCLQRGYGNCPRYLRGVLVIPTEELEALRRPAPDRPAPPPPRPAAAPAGGGGRRAIVAAALVLLLVAGGGLGAFVLLNQDGGVAQQTPSPSASSQPSTGASATGSAATTLPSATPFPETPKPEPTPQPGDTFIGYDVTVLVTDYTIYRIGQDGEILQERPASFSDFSRARVAEVTAPNGLHYWRTLDGDYTGWSYIHDRSGPFQIREVYQGSDGQLRYAILPEDRL